MIHVRRGLALLGLLGLLAACGSDAAEKASAPPGPPSNDATTNPDNDTRRVASGAYVVFADDVHPTARDRFTSLLHDALGKDPTVATSSTLPPSLDANAIVIAIGASDLARTLVPDAERSALAPEGYVVRSGKRGDATLLVADGAPAKDRPHGNLGALHGAYALLEELGYGFLHPLAPLIPKTLRVPSVSIDIKEAPRWDVRRLHIHTQHPLELTEMLQGFPEDQRAFDAQLDEWDRFLEWCVANGENGVEWFLLWAESYKAFADSDTRIGHLAELVERAHRFGLAAGIDAPIAFQQQHSFRLLRNQGELKDELYEIDARLDWLDRASWDFYGIEAGTSEFTHPDPAKMLAWENEVAKHLDEAHDHKRAFVKVHCSTGQSAEGFTDPLTNEPIDFNQLPHFADPRLGVLPHTVEHYGLQDPAPTYGNTNFGYIRDFLHREAGTRPTVYYPESAYWVSFDVDVPLFLPLYGERRLSDLQMLVNDELAGAKKMDGQLVFSSGWEWGYWLNDVIAARAAWNPHADFKTMLGHVLRPLGSAKDDIAAWIADIATAQKDLLIDGKVRGNPPSKIEMRNGQAYIQGWETWDDVAKLAQGKGFPMPATQPDKLGLVDMRNPIHSGPGYSKEVEPLLAEMETRFGEMADRGVALRARVPEGGARDLMDDLADAMQMTSLRTRQVHGLYDYVDGYFASDQAPRKLRLAAARKALDDALPIVAARETRYRVPADRIAAWRNNPTAYEYGYLWSVRSLYYWWRDEGKAVDAPLLPCYQNITNPVDVAIGEGIGADLARVFGDWLSDDESRGCLAEPSAEPKFPQEDLRSRPK